MNVDTYIASLVQYGVNRSLIEECDRTYITNQLLQALSLDSCEPAAPAEMPLEEILKGGNPVRLTVRQCGDLS